jgi:cobalt-zinc-cadmium efflux system outer membrane protein
MHQWLIGLFLLPLAAPAAFAEPARNSLTLEQAVVNVLERSPALKAADFEAKAAAARIRSARLTPAVQTSVDLENFGGSGIRSGTDSLETTLSLAKVLELGRKARLRGDVAEQEAILLRTEQDAERLDLLVETAKRFVQVVADQENLVIAEDTLALVKRTKTTIQQRVNAGKSANAELRYVDIAAAKTELERDHARHALASSRLRLATLWGEVEPAFTEAKADLFAVEAPQSFELLAQSLERNPDLVRYLNEDRLAKTRIELARSRRKADVELVGGLRHFNLTDDTGLVMSLNIPLGNASRARPKVDEAELGLRRNSYDLEQRRLELYATLFEVHQEVEHATDATAVYRDTIIPLSERALRDYEQGYRSGRYSLLELLVAQRTLLDARLEAVLAAADYHRYRIEIDRLTGAGLASGKPR